MFLYEELDTLKKAGVFPSVLPSIIESGLSENIELRDYQTEAFKRFIYFFENDKSHEGKQIHTLFHMATGSGKTVIMAGLILYLYTKGYRKFLFFVNQKNVLEKTIQNFTNPSSGKYLFNEKIEHLGNRIRIKKTGNFTGGKLHDEIEIAFTTTQKLNSDLSSSKENSLTDDDFESDKIVFISDESHHVNSKTKKAKKDEEESTWEDSVMKAFSSNKESIMLEFTATCDLKNKNVLEKYRDKIIFNYPLAELRKSGYTKDFQNFASDSSLWTRTLMALVMSEYRRFLFSDLKINIKPVILLKSQRINESESFYKEFFNKVKNLTGDELENLTSSEIDILQEALNYFKEKDESLTLLAKSIKISFTQDTSIIMNGETDNTKEKQLLVNSLEDTKNPIRLIFTVDMLNEGWDVLNLFDIVRLYDTRQSLSGGKIGSYTIKEAQLIGRAARYCPFTTDDETFRFKRKYDTDLKNKKRVLETMYFHSKNDSRYIAELKKALTETGLESSSQITLEYKLKEEFKKSDFYRTASVYSNKREKKTRSEMYEIEASMQAKRYYYSVPSGKGNITSLFDDEGEYNEKKREMNAKERIETLEFKDIDMNILSGAAECFEALRFDFLKQKYPHLASKKEFLTSSSFLGDSKVEIKYPEKEKLRGKDVFHAVKKALNEVASYVMNIKEEYIGTKEFTPKKISEILKDRKIYLEKEDVNGGKGDSQNNSSNEEYRLNLGNEKWYVFTDHYGTSEEKGFIKYFKTDIEPLLKEKCAEYYVIRNERVGELAIYSFEEGKRFEADFLLFVRKKNERDYLAYQAYIEPKGSHLLLEDAWKEEFLRKIKEEFLLKRKNEGKVQGEYKILGFPFFNSEERLKEFREAVEEFIQNL